MFRKTTKEQQFWKWFVDNSNRIFNFESDREAIFDELASHMHKVNQDLTFEFSSIDDGKREFIVSADGVREAFSAVRSLVDVAPVLEQWIIIPFRPPKDIGVVRIGNYSLGPDDVWFSHEPDGERVGLTLYIRDLTDENERVATQAAFILLDGALGEYDVEEKVGLN
jgi:hypothetical protein